MDKMFELFIKKKKHFLNHRTTNLSTTRNTRMDYSPPYNIQAKGLSHILRKSLEWFSWLIPLLKDLPGFFLISQM